MRNPADTEHQAHSQSTSYCDLEKRAGSKNIPMYCHLELTHACNQNCIHCYVVKDVYRSVLSFEELQHALDQLAEPGVLYLALIRGEIFMRRDFFRIAGYARKKIRSPAIYNWQSDHTGICEENCRPVPVVYRNYYVRHFSGSSRQRNPIAGILQANRYGY